MNLLRSLFSYPLLMRELSERAARKRTYVVRVLYGLILYAIFVVAVQRLVTQAALDPTGLGGLGFGRELFGTLIILQCWAVLFLQPALMAGVITYEKERESLSLLLLTGMRPVKIVLEKYLAGLLPMATLLLLALPLGAITMGYGGVSLELLTASACVVLAAWLMTGAWALLCSAWCRTTVGAMLATYIVGTLILLAPAIGYSLSQRDVLFGANLTGVHVPEWLWALWPPEAFARLLEWQKGVAALASGGPGWSALLQRAWIECAPMVGTAAVCLLLASLVLKRRGLSSRVLSDSGRDRPRHPLVAAFVRGGARVVSWWHVIWPPPPALPVHDPVAWRESGQSRHGGRVSFLYSSVLLAGGVLALSLVLMGLYPPYDGSTRLHYFAIIMGAVAVLVLIVRATGSLLNEHTNQTLGILLTAPIGADEILREKAKALTRYRVLFAVVLGIVFFLQGWSEFEYRRANMKWQELGQFWSCTSLALAVYPGLIVWVSLFFALWLRARSKAILATLCVFAVWFVAPLVLLDYGLPDWRKPTPDHPQNTGLWLSLLSPLGILVANEDGHLGMFSIQVIESRYVKTGIGQPWVPVVANFGGYLLLTYLIRFLCLRFADRFLRR